MGHDKIQDKYKTGSLWFWVSTWSQMCIALNQLMDVAQYKQSTNATSRILVKPRILDLSVLNLLMMAYMFSL